MRNIGRNRVSQTPPAAVDEFQPHLSLKTGIPNDESFFPIGTVTFVDLEHFDVNL